MFVMYLYNRLYPIGLLVIGTKQRVRENVYTTTMLLFFCYTFVLEDPLRLALQCWNM